MSTDDDTINKFLEFNTQFEFMDYHVYDNVFSTSSIIKIVEENGDIMLLVNNDTYPPCTDKYDIEIYLCVGTEMKRIKLSDIRNPIYSTRIHSPSVESCACQLIFKDFISNMDWNLSAVFTHVFNILPQRKVIALVHDK